MPTAQDTAIVRSLIRARRDAGWTHRPYGGGRHQDHVWTAPASSGPSRLPRNTIRPRKVTFYEGELEYRNAGASKISATIRPDTIADVVGWLRLLGLIGERAIVVDERSSTSKAVGAPSDRHMSEVGV
jgi:hypothetical protein